MGICLIERLNQLYWSVPRTATSLSLDGLQNTAFRINSGGAIIRAPKNAYLIVDFNSINYNIPQGCTL
jgi:hypothetical protein